MEKKNRDYVTVATKMSSAANKRIEKIARKKGLTKYDLIQMVCDTIIRYMDDEHNLTPEMERAMSIFEHMVGWKDAFNLADPYTTPEVVEATYYLTGENKRGVRGVHVKMPFFGTWTQTANIQQIIERTICQLSPERYRRLRALAVEMDCSSLLDLFDALIDYHAKEQDVASMREEFEDANRSEYGQKPVSNAYKRHHKATMDMFEESERKKLEEEKQKEEEERKRIAERSEEARIWLEENMPFKPFCTEW